ncbi:unnamed protein product [Cuscuta campestris]|uniref:Uncharacterized protein n=1 Tax=Cuscuta campestris TaxID=132261 RepID=A0A484L253_9ASTE|nr:unnamed protein product [Cuscuta campestris]
MKRRGSLESGEVENRKGNLVGIEVISVKGIIIVTIEAKTEVIGTVTETETEGTIERGSALVAMILGLAAGHVLDRENVPAITIATGVMIATRPNTTAIFVRSLFARLRSTSISLI